MQIYQLRRLSVVAASLAIMSAGLTGVLWLDIYNREKGSEVVFMDIGQGDSILIKSRYGQNILIDAGPDAGVLGRLGRNLSFFENRLDLIIATHPDTDHIGGLAFVLGRYKASALLEPGVAAENLAYPAMLAAAAANGVPVTIASPAIYELGDNVWLSVIHPSSRPENVSDTNSASITALYSDHGSRFLFTGDIPRETEALLVQKYGANLAADVLKVAHHGSQTSSSEEFLKTVGAAAGVIQAGRDNRYGHPHLSVLRRLNKAGMVILRTDELGDIRMRANGQTIELIQ